MDWNGIAGNKEVDRLAREDTETGNLIQIVPWFAEVFVQDQRYVPRYVVMMYLSALLSVLTAFIGFVGIYLMHNDLYESGQYIIKPLINKIDQVTIKLNIMKWYLLNAYRHAKNITSTSELIPKPLFETIRFLVKRHDKNYFTKPMKELKAAKDYFQGALKKERTYFILENVLWLCAIPLPIILMILMKKYTYIRIKAVNYICPAMLVSMLFTMIVCSILHYYGIQLADFCHNATINLVKHNPISKINNHTAYYYLTCTNESAAINLAEAPVTRLMLENISFYIANYTDLKLNNQNAYNFHHLQRSVDRFMELSDYFKSCRDSKNYYQELRVVICENSLQGLLLQASVAGPWNGFFLTLTLIALCRVRAWQRALLCLKILGNPFFESKVYHKDCLDAIEAHCYDSQPQREDGVLNLESGVSQCVSQSVGGRGSCLSIYRERLLVVSAWRVVEEVVMLSDHHHIVLDVVFRRPASSRRQRGGPPLRWSLKRLDRDLPPRRGWVIPTLRSRTFRKGKRCGSRP
ncbi:uncharacterized protein LOC113233937 [Hyposmocoma kahamanoa]|uniref:uncharacterized protein LOC113233937 n=1 Tax=Hyposmocoma kahamanoa TaxID=1477025 RepID=UPI000E6D8FC3|nr:uncharacterized protein LOC113233937 [Hyposmocoma kahamanoa]